MRNEHIRRGGLVVLTSLLLVSGIGVHAAAWSSGLSEEARQALEGFTHRDCETGDQHSALGRAIAHATEVEPQLIELLSAGPGPESLEAFRRGLEEEWALRKAFLAQSPETGLSLEHRQQALGESWSDYQDRAEARFRSMTRERAAFALAAIGTATSFAALREIAEQADGETKAVIASALRRFSQDPGPGATRGQGASPLPRTKRVHEAKR